MAGETIVQIIEQDTPLTVVVSDSPLAITETSTVVSIAGGSDVVLIEKPAESLILEAAKQGPAGPPGTAEEEVPYAERTDMVGETVIYKGQANPGSSEASAVWRIKRLTITGDDVVTEWADGNANFDNVWADRATLSYA